MRRRQIVQWITGAFGTPLVEGPVAAFVAGGALGSIAYTPRANAASDPSRLSVRLSGVFMEDRAMQRAASVYDGVAVPFRTRSGLQVVFNAVFLSWAPQLQRLVQQPEGPTGWAQELLPLPAYRNARGAAPSSVRLAVLPGGGSAPDRLFAGRPGLLGQATLDADGALSGGYQTLEVSGLELLAAGTLPVGTRYLPLLGAPAAVTDGPQRRLHLMSTSGGVLPVDPPLLQRDASTGAAARVLPLADAGDGAFRCIVHDEASGDVYSLRLVLDRAAGRFHVVERQPLYDQVPAGCCAVVEPVPGQPTVIVVDHAVRLQGRRLELLRMVAVATFAGHYDPSQANASVRWDAPKFDSLASPPESHGVESRTIQVHQHPTRGTLELALQVTRYWNTSIDNSDEARDHPAGTYVYIAGRSAGGTWSALEPLGPGAAFAGFCQGAADFYVARPGVGFEHWRHEPDGELDRESIEVPAAEDGIAAMTACHRVGLCLALGAVPLANEPVLVSASEPVRASINGRRVLLGPNRPLPAVSGADGVLWVEVLMEEHAKFPTLIFGSTRLQRRLSCDLDAKARSFYAAIDGDTLRNARDPQGGQALFSSSDGADAIAQAVREMSRAAPEALPEPGPPPPGVDLHLDPELPCAWSPLTTATAMAAVPRRRVASGSIRSFHLRGGPSGAHFRLLGADEAVTLQKTLRANARRAAPGAPPGVTVPGATATGVAPMGIFGDISDFFSDLGGAIADGVGRAFDLAIHGLEATLAFVIDGVNFVFDFVLNTLEAVLDAINIVLDQVGFALGRGLRWLLKLVGFVFDWEKIVARSHALKGMLRSRVTAFVNALPDPVPAARDLHARIDAVKATVLDGLGKYRQTSAPRQAYGSQMSGGGTMLDILSYAGDAGPKVTWLLEKLQGVLKVAPLPVLSIPALDTALGDLRGARFDGFSAFGQAMQQAISGWFTDTSNFAGGVLDVLLGVFSTAIDGVFTTLGGLVEAIGAALGALRSAPVAIIDWLDRPLGKGLLNGFWRGLTDDEFTLLGAACLLPAIVIELGLANSVHTPARVAAAAADTAHPLARRITATAQADDEWAKAAMAFQISNIVFSAASATVTALTPGDATGLAALPSQALTLLSLSCVLGFTVCCAWDQNSDIKAIALTSAITAACGIIGAAYIAGDRAQRTTLRLVLQGISACWSFAQLIYLFGQRAKASTLGFVALNLTAATMTLVVGIMASTSGNKPAMNLVPALVYGAAQGALSAGKFALYEYG